MSGTVSTLGARGVLLLEGKTLLDHASTSTDTTPMEARRSLVDSGSACLTPVAQGTLVSMRMALESREDEILVPKTMASESERQDTC